MNMNYIVLDMEWNQPLSYDSHIFKTIGDKLLFEVIQIGAVKLNAACEIVDRISVLVKPSYYVKVHPRISRLTGLNKDTLDGAPAFCEAMTQFISWCGEDCVFLTWGCDDISVLKQNMDFFSCEAAVPPFYDIQLLFSEVFKLGKDRKGLQSAMALLEIEPEETHTFHNALSDAYYTALVFQKLPEPQGVLRFKQQPRKLSHVQREEKIKGRVLRFDDVNQLFAADDICAPTCRTCNQPMVQDGRYVRQSGNKYAGLFRCGEHGVSFVELKLFLLEGEKVTAALRISDAGKLMTAYIHTKQLQPLPHTSALQALRDAIRSDVPFEND